MLGSYIKGLRIKRGISLRQLAIKLDYDVSYLSKLERELIPPPNNDSFYDKLWSLFYLSYAELTKIKSYAKLDRKEMPIDIKNYGPVEFDYIPIILRNINGNKFSEEQYKKLLDYINSGEL